MHGAPSYLTEKVNTLSQIVNGTACTLHSLTWNNPNDTAVMQDLISQSPDGEVVKLPITPTYVNVQLLGHSLWNPQHSLLGSEAYVIPIGIAKKKISVKVRGSVIPAKVHGLELGFSVTLHKLQSKNIPLLILSIYKRGCPPEISLMALLVALSRVREGRNVRLLPPHANAGLTPFAHLRNLRSSENFRIWIAGFDDNGIWSAERASQARRNNQVAIRITRTSQPRTRRSGRRTQAGTGEILNQTAATPTTTTTTTTEVRNPETLIQVNESEQPSTTTTQPRTSRNQSTQPHQPPTASPFFVPFLCAVSGKQHSRIDSVRNHVNAVHDQMWETMVRRTVFVHQYVLINGNELDKQQVNQAAWPWQRVGPDWYIHANSQEWLLSVEGNYPEIIFPENCIHPHFMDNFTCGERLQQHFMEWWHANQI